MKQAFNPFLPLHEYIPDGEPHVFGDRVYHYGSHDKEGGYTFCMNDYVVYSAPVDDLTDWRYEGVSYKAEQDPGYPNPQYMYAPDVVKGNDGKYYLYYCMGGDYGYGGYSGPISVAVSDTPAGPFAFKDYVHYADGTILKKYVCFDPAVINDNGTIRVYYGTQYDFEERVDYHEHPEIIEDEMKMFWKSKEEILYYLERPESCPDCEGTDARDSINGAVMVVLEDDMVTVKEEPRHIIPYRVKGTSFEEHPFFEGPSMRKVGEKYYFVYSSWLNHELCYAVSDYPDRGFVFGGTIVSNGDVGYKGRTNSEKLNMTGTTHGSIIEINGQWYVFYHRLTHKSDYSRQACAEKIYFDENGAIKQVEVTSCGLNDGPLVAQSGYEYPAVIACNITNGRMPHGSNSIYKIPFPNVSHKDDERFIAEVEDGTLIGFKYFDFQNVSKFMLTARAENEKNRVVYDGPLRIDERCDEEVQKSEEQVAGKNKFDAKGCLTDSSDSEKALCDADYFFEIRLEEHGECVGVIPVFTDKAGNELIANDWTVYEGDLTVSDGVHALYLIYHGEQKLQLLNIAFL